MSYVMVNGLMMAAPPGYSIIVGAGGQPLVQINNGQPALQPMYGQLAGANHYSQAQQQQGMIGQGPYGQDPGRGMMMSQQGMGGMPQGMGGQPQSSYGQPQMSGGYLNHLPLPGQSLRVQIGMHGPYKIAYPIDFNTYALPTCTGWPRILAGDADSETVDRLVVGATYLVLWASNGLLYRLID